MRDAPGIWTVIGEQSSVRAGFRAAVALTPFRLGEKKINTTAITGSASRSSTKKPEVRDASDVQDRGLYETSAG